MATKIYNPTKHTVTLYSNDLDSVDVFPELVVPVDDKFKSRLPRIVKDRTIANTDKTFTNPLPPIVGPPVVNNNTVLYMLGFI